MMHRFTDTPCGRALARCEEGLDRPLTKGEMADFLLDNFMEIANSDEAHQIRDSVLIEAAPEQCSCGRGEGHHHPDCPLWDSHVDNYEE